MSQHENLAVKITNESEKYNFHSDYGNELFLYHVVPVIEEEYFGTNVNKNDLGITYVNPKEKNLVDTKRKKLKELKKAVLFTLILGPLIFLATAFLSVFLLLFRKHNSEVESRKLSIIRTKAAWSKIKKQERFDDYVFLSDDFSFKINDSNSLYEQSLSARFSCIYRLPKVVYYDCINLYKDIEKLCHDNVDIGIYKKLVIRMPYKIVYELYLESLLRKNNCKSFLSGNKEDRYAILEKRVCKKFKVSTVCVPHGLEYGFRMPRGLFGDRFYCTSMKSKKLLEKIYNKTKQKFLFDKEIATHMFGSDEKYVVANEPKIVFFPESREINVNQSIIRTLLNLSSKVFLKLHPSDCYSNYSEFVGMECIINDLDDSLNGTICLARRSTVLLESAYRKGYPCAVLFNQKDRVYVEQIFPSLSNPMIKSVYNLDELKDFLNGV